MKKWNTPSLEELSLNATAYSPSSGSRVDGVYLSKDGLYTHNSYGGSDGNSGTPILSSNHPGIVPAGSNGFVHVD